MYILINFNLSRLIVAKNILQQALFVFSNVTNWLKNRTFV